MPIDIGYLHMRDSLSFLRALPLCSLAAMPAMAQTDFFSAGASVRQLWDSNYERRPEKESERITVSSAFVALDKTLSRQRHSVDTERRHRFRDRYRNRDKRILRRA